MNKPLISLLLLFMAIDFCNAQQEKINIEDSEYTRYRYGVSASLNSLLAGGVAFDAFVSNQLNIEVSGAIFLTRGGEVGINYHPFNTSLLLNIKKWSPYIGLHTGLYQLFFLTRTDYSMLYIPLGIRFFNKNHYSVSLDAGYSIQKIAKYAMGGIEPYNTEIFHLPHGSIKLGYRF
jgi:hypothetical protein